VRSFEASALRRAEFMPAIAGALSSVRNASTPQAGQAHGSWNCTIGRIAVNGPHVEQL
jgi:hypothetical protein